MAEVKELPPKGPLAEGFAYWTRIRGEREFALYAGIDPVDMRRFLANVILVDVLSSPRDFCFRLIGSSVDSIISRNYRGVRFSELPHMRAGNKVWSEYETVVDTGQPIWSEIAYVGREQSVRSVRHCLMPLSTDGNKVDIVFGVVDVIWAV